MRRRDLLVGSLAAASTAAAAADPAIAKKGQLRRRRRDDRDDRPGNQNSSAFTEPLPAPPTAVPVGHTEPGPGIEDRFNDLNFDGLTFDDLDFDCQGMIRTEPTDYYLFVVEEAEIPLGAGLSPAKIWRYRDVNQPSSSPFIAGPTFKVFMNEDSSRDAGLPGAAAFVRMKNMLPENHVGFGVPHLTTHLHGGHMLSSSDGFPEEGDGVELENGDELHPTFAQGEAFNYCYHLRDVGFRTDESDPTERPSTLWYHDHLLDFTGPNVYRGLSGFFLVFDELDRGDEDNTDGLQLPSGDFDIPLVLQDRKLDGNDQLLYLPEDHDGVLGDRHLVNGTIQPFLTVQRRKYRFRILNGANARHYQLFVVDERGQKKRFDLIATEGGLLSRPLRNRKSILMSNAQRRELVFDFSDYPAGTKLYLENRLEQDDGRGPDGDFEDPDLEARTRLLEFRIEGGPVGDPSRVPDVLRPFDPIPQSKINGAKQRHFKFERRRGAWAINGEFIDIDRPLVRPKLGQPEIWTLENGGGGWWHPIHIHLEFVRILSRNGKRPPLEERDGIAKADTITLGPGDEVNVFIEFRDFPGSWVFHCHNIEHEDMFMMARFDVEAE
jgi:FtsP/CotA-like multicopper oxidase with cupredoxin domain